MPLCIQPQYCSIAALITPSIHHKYSQEVHLMFYKSVVVECSTGIEDLAKAIEKKAEEMLKKGTYKLVAMSTVGTDQAILVFKL